MWERYFAYHITIKQMLPNFRSWDIEFYIKVRFNPPSPTSTMWHLSTQLQRRFVQLMYRVINKEGHKVLDYKTIKKCDFDAFKMFLASKNMGHFDIK